MLRFLGLFRLLASFCTRITLCRLNYVFGEDHNSNYEIMFQCTVFRYVTPCSLVDRIKFWRNLFQFRGISAQEEAEGTWDMLLPSNQTTRLHVPEDLPNASFKSQIGFRMHRITCVDHITWISEATTDVCVFRHMFCVFFLYAHFLQTVNLIYSLCWYETRIFVDLVSLP